MNYCYAIIYSYYYKLIRRTSIARFIFGVPISKFLWINVCYEISQRRMTQVYIFGKIFRMEEGLNFFYKRLFKVSLRVCESTNINNSNQSSFLSDRYKRLHHIQLKENMLTHCRWLNMVLVFLRTETKIYCKLSKKLSIVYIFTAFITFPFERPYNAAVTLFVLKPMFIHPLLRVLDEIWATRPWINIIFHISHWALLIAIQHSNSNNVLECDC
jgi:hypothetical protein